ncbi:MAG: peroxiredoxin, partial [Candidatus Eisenbacteria bacterium]|nr:peroxiredoxin [Candidatus Eisenbacteria bacterium]
GPARAEDPVLCARTPEKAATAEASATEGLLEPGTAAPDFTLPDASGKPVRLADLLEQPLLLYFYPKDNSPGCTKEACAFRDDYGAFEKAGVRVAGVSTDSPSSHVAFAAKYNLPFTLLSDESGDVSRAYGVAFEMKRGDVPAAVIAKRTTYLIGTDGKILHVWPKVEPAGHSAEILSELPSILKPAGAAPADEGKK